MSIEVKNLSYKYNKNTPLEVVALDNISFFIPDNSFVGIIGHTGSGKSTLMQTFNSLIEAEGEIYIDGKNINESSKNKIENRKNVGLVFQYPEHQLFELTVYKDIAFGPVNLGMTKDEIENNIKKAIEIVGLDESYYEKSPFDLSGGQKRKVAIAGVLALNPKILILDEPTAGLDPKSRDDLLNKINDMHKKLGITIILVSHSMEDVSKYAEKIIVLNEGKLVYDDTPKNIFKNREYLESIGLTVPRTVYLMEKLREKGFDVPRDIFDTEEVANIIYDLLKVEKI